MELRQLRYFIAVAEELHFGRAARRMHVSQPPLSMQIKALEDELGFALFQRTKRRVSLTEAGAAMLEEVRAALARLERAVERARQVERGQAGVLRLGFVGPALDGPLPRGLAALARLRPELRQELHGLSSAEQTAAIIDGSLDMGVVRAWGAPPPELHAVAYWSEDYVLAVPHGHALAGRGRVGPADIAAEPLILFPREAQPQLHDAMIGAFHAVGLRPVVAQRARTKQTAVAMAAAGLGLALVPRSTAAARPESVRALAVDAPLPRVELALVWRRDRDWEALAWAAETLADAVRG